MFLMRFSCGERNNPARARHVHRGHELLLVEEGRGRQLVGPAEVPCVARDIFVFPAGLQHMSCSSTGEGFTALVLNGEPGDLADGRPGDGGRGMLEAIVGSVPAGGQLSIRPAMRQQAVNLIRQALGELHQAGLGARCAARALVMEALVLLARAACDAPVQRDLDAEAAEGHVELALRWIAEYWMTPIRITDLMALGPLGRSQLLARFRARTGRTVGQAVLAIRLEQAQRMLRAGGSGHLDIALSCGFGSQSHFNHHFKRATGMSPRSWVVQGSRPSTPC